MEQYSSNGRCRCPHHKMVAALITLLGLVFFANAMAWIPMRFADLAWPAIILAIGLVKLFEHKCECCDRDRK